MIVDKTQVVELVDALLKTGRPFEQYEFEDKLKCLLPPSWIEAAILELDALSAGSKQRSDMLAGEGSSLAARGELRIAGEWNRLADLGRYFLTGEKDQSTWKDKDLGL